MADVWLGRPAARITRLRNGQFYATNCLLRYDDVVPAEDAIVLAQAHKVAFVERDQVKIVLAALTA